MAAPGRVDREVEKAPADAAALTVQAHADFPDVQFGAEGLGAQEAAKLAGLIDRDSGPATGDECAISLFAMVVAVRDVRKLRDGAKQLARGLLERRERGDVVPSRGADEEGRSSIRHRCRRSIPPITVSSDQAPPPRKINGSWIAAQLRWVGQASG